MNKIYTKLLIGFLFVLGNFSANAQVSLLMNPTYGYTFLNTTTTYTSLGAGGTVFQSGATLNTDANSSAITLPFVFTYNGIKENTIFINNNGYITFALAQSTASNTLPLSTTTTSGYDGAIAGLANNLVAAASGTPEIRYGTNVGGDFVVQFQDLAISTFTSTRITFQIILKVDAKTVQIVYGPNNTGQTSATGSQVGLRGTNDEDWNNRTLSSGGNWNTAGGAAGTLNTSTMTWTATSTLPTSGRTFQWSPTTYVPTYLASPIGVCQDFTTWTNGSGLANVPTTNWATNGYGNASWQIDNTPFTTTTSGWTNNSGPYSPVDYVSAVGGHSARFHTFQSNSPQVGYLDYYVNLSTATGSVNLDFYQINPSGTDILQVYLSTDGGTTFSAVGAASYGVATSWTARNISLGAITSATTIIRFKATSDFGSDDIGLDHVCLSTACTPPVSQATIAAYTNNVSPGTGITVNWARGTPTPGDAVIVVGRLTATTNVDPSNTTTYTANSAFGSGTGSAITGTGNFVVYIGTGTTVNVTGLTQNTGYTFTVYEYANAGPCYKTAGSSSPVTTAACTPPVSQATIGTYTNNVSPGTGITVNWTRGTPTPGDAVIVVARLTATSNVSPISNTSYTANTVFGAGTGSAITGTGNYVVYNGTGTSVDVTGLSQNTSYTFTVYEYAFSGACYLTPGSSSAVTTFALPIVIVPATLNNTVTCGTSSALYDDGGAGGAYSNNDDGYTVLDNSGTGVITLSGTYAGIETCCDMIRIYSGAGTGGTLLATYGAAGSGTITTIVSSPGQVLTVRFTSDGSTTGAGFAFNAVYSGTCNSCTTPSTVSVGSITSTTASVTFTSGGSNFIVEYGAVGFTPGTAASAGTGGTVVTGTSSPISISGLSANTSYDVYVRQVCAGPAYSNNSSVATFTTSCASLTLPYSQNFDGVTAPAIPSCWVIRDVNGDGTKWVTATGTASSGSSSPNVLHYSYNTTNAANDWAATPGFDLVGGITYTLTYKYANSYSSATYSEKLEVKYATANDAATLAAGTSLLATETYPAYMSSFATKTISFTPVSSGTYYIGFHCVSDANQGYLDIDDVTVSVCANQSYGSSTVTQNNVSSVNRGTTTNEVIAIPITINGACGSSQDATSFTLNTTGTTATADIANAKLWYTGTSSTFAATTQFGSTNATPTGSYSITGTQTLVPGVNYFWLTYDVVSGATSGNVIDAQCTSVTVGGNPYTPTTTAPSGTRTIISTKSWVGIGSGGAGTDFNTATNWSPNGVPDANDDLTIAWTTNADAAITMSANASAKSITITDTYTPTAARTHSLTTNAFSLSISGAMNVTNNGGGSSATNTAFTYVVVSAGGSLSVGGNLAATCANVSTNSNVIVFQNSGTMLVTGTTTASVANTSSNDQIQFLVDNSPAVTTFTGAFSSTAVSGTVVYLASVAAGTSTGTMAFKGNATFGTRTSTTTAQIIGNYLFDGATASTQTITFTSTTLTGLGNVIVGGTVSGNSPTVVFSGSGAPTLSSLATSANLTVNNAAILDLGTSTLNRSTAGGKLTLASTATLRLGATTGGQTGSNFPSGFNTWGDGVASTTSFSPTSTVEYYGGAQTIFATPVYGNLTITTAGLKTAGAGLTIGGNVLINSGTFVSGAFSHSVAGNWTNNSAYTGTGGTVVFNGNGASVTQVIGGSVATDFKTLTIATGAKVRSDVATVAATAFNVNGTGYFIHNGIATLPGGTRTFNNTGLPSTQSTIEYQNNSSLTTAPVSANYGNLVINIPYTGNVGAGGNLASIGGNLIIQNTGGFELRMNSTQTATNNIGGKISVEGVNAKLVIANGASGAGTPIVNVGGNLEVSAGTFNISTNTGAPVLNVTGNVILSGGTFQPMTNTGIPSINVKGDWTNNGGTFTPGSTTVTFNNTTAAQAINGSATAASFQFLTVEKAGQTLSVGGSTNTLNIGGSIALNAGTFDAGTATSINMTGGDWTAASGTTFTPGSSTVNFSSTSVDQNINGTAASQTFNNITVAKSAKKLNISGSTATARVSGTLTMTSGNIDCGSGTLELGTSTSTVGSLSYSSGNIIGNFKRWIAAAGPLSFPVGTAADNMNALVTFTDLTAGSLTAKYIASNAGSSGLPLSENSLYITSQFTEGYWTLISGDGLASTNYALELTGTNFTSHTQNANTRIIKRANAGSWSLTGAGTHVAASGNVAKRAGLSGFSEFAQADTYSPSANDYYRSVTSGDWNNNATWESSPDGVTWYAASFTPASASNNVTIVSPHTVTITASVSVDQVTINSGATLMVNSGQTLTINDGTGNDMTVNGSFITAGTIDGTGQIAVNNILQINEGGWPGNTATYTYGASGTLVFNNTSGSYGVGNDGYWPSSSGPVNVTVANTGGITMNITRSVSGIFQTVSGVTNANNLNFDGTAKLNSGGYFTGSPTYGSSSTLIYNTGGTYGRGAEWNATSGAGYPNNVQVSNSTTLNYPNGSTSARSIGGSLTIDAGSALYMDYGSPGTSNPFTVTGNVTLNGNLSLGDAIGGDLNVGGNWSLNTGTFTHNSRAVKFNGTSAQTIGGSSSNSFAYLTMSGSGTKTFESNCTLTNEMSFETGSGNVDLDGAGDNKSFTIKSTSTTTARIANTNGTTINGKATVERYINTDVVGRKWHLLSGISTTNASQTIRNSWQEGGGAPSVANLGTWITKPGGGSGYDGTSNSGSLLRYDNTVPSLSAVTATNSGSINDEQGYFLFVRGDRYANAGNAFTTPTVLRTTGTLNQGPQNITISNSVPGYSLVGNPYASALDLETPLTTTNLGQFFYIWDASQVGNYGVGKYILVEKTGAGTYSATPTTGSDNSLRYIHSGQAFFLKTNGAGNANITFNETDKAASTSVVNPIVNSENDQQLYVGLGVVTAGNVETVADAVRIRFNPGYTAATTDDIEKIGNFSDNVSSYRNGKRWIVEMRPLVVNTDTIFLKMANTGLRNYRFTVSGINFTQPNVTAWLQDAFTGVNTPLNLMGAPTALDFSVTSDPASANADRFRIVFTNTGSPLPVTITSVKAAQQGANIAVEWKVSNQQNIAKYEVEKSTNGTNFAKVNSQDAVGINGSDMTYNWIDQQAVTGDNFYRIRSIGTGGEVKISQVVKVTISKGKPAITVYPNPVVNHTIAVQFTDMEKGTYQLRLINTVGQVVYMQSISHAGGSVTQTLKLATGIANGNYQLEILKPDNTRTLRSLMIIE